MLHELSTFPRIILSNSRLNVSLLAVNGDCVVHRRVSSLRG
jgi:hypothetical protein